MIDRGAPMNSQKSDPEQDWNSTDPFSQNWTDLADKLLREKNIIANQVTKTVDGQTYITVQMDGICPRCKHRLSQRIPHSAVGIASTVGDGVSKGDKKVPFEMTFECDCGEAHLGRPTGTLTGCGIVFTLRVSTET